MATFENAHRLESGLIVVDIDGVATTVPNDPENRHFAAMTQAGIVIAPYAPPAPAADDVRAEASRRMQALVGARDAAHLDLIITNGTREAVRLLRDGAAQWTPEQAKRAAELEAIDRAFEAIRAASNAMEPAPPADYADARHWP